MSNKDLLIDTINDFKKNSNENAISIHGKSYNLVSDRIAFARRNLGSRLTIKNQIVSIDAETVVFKTSVFIDGKLIATAHAEENRKASKINQTSALEVCETSAAGRALGMCGISNDNLCSADELNAALMAQDKKTQDALRDLKNISHAGSYQSWISNNKSFLADMKKKNPLAYQDFMLAFTEVKTQLKQKGVIQ